MRELTIEEMMMVSGVGSLDAKDGANYGGNSAGVVVLVQLQEVLREMQQAPLLAGLGEAE
ncbi:hypothetical protein [Brucella sp. NBRC 12950]|uniref:hypothetical protein n=1 Tax=Brucella sp. NBRC 12950 TaxID=2994518 RepID=UPI0024A1257F|nr:hypothetical protein [Brucella sp. NBRC 12950]GLU29173.1 hypothetical protein Brsp01_44060 [Brucella sp. NBRC 12950]